jgi:hypothetical protein
MHIFCQVAEQVRIFYKPASHECSKDDIKQHFFSLTDKNIDMKMQFLI